MTKSINEIRKELCEKIIKNEAGTISFQFKEPLENTEHATVKVINLNY